MSDVAVPKGVAAIDAPGSRRRHLIEPVIGLALAFLALLVLLAVFGPLVEPHDPDQQSLITGVTGPGGNALLGTDDLGRDVLSRVIAGTRIMLVGPTLVAFGAMAIGMVFGLTAGYVGGYVDAGIMRWVDLMSALPGLLIVIVVAGALGGGYWLSVALLIVLSAPYDTRIIRGAALEQRPLPYVEAAEVLGLRAPHIMFRHVLPNVAPVIVANTFLTFAISVVALSALSFLGIGVEPGTADWGLMLSESRLLIFDNPLAALAPGIMIVLTAVSVNLIGDWAYELLSDRGRAR